MIYISGPALCNWNRSATRRDPPTVQQSLTSCWVRNGLTECSFLNQFWKLISPWWEHVCSCRSPVPVQQCPPPSQHPLILANCESQVWRKHKSYLWFLLWPTRQVCKTRLSAMHCNMCTGTSQYVPCNTWFFRQYLEKHKKTQIRT